MNKKTKGEKNEKIEKKEIERNIYTFMPLYV